MWWYRMQIAQVTGCVEAWIHNRLGLQDGVQVEEHQSITPAEPHTRTTRTPTPKPPPYHPTLRHLTPPAGLSRFMFLSLIPLQDSLSCPCLSLPPFLSLPPSLSLSLGNPLHKLFLVTRNE